MKTFFLLSAFLSLALAVPSYRNDKCEACMSFMEEFNKGLEKKFELIETAILDQCYQLPEQDQQRCLKEVKLELDALYEKVKNFVEPNKVCKFFHLCNKSETFIYKKLVHSLRLVNSKKNFSNLYFNNLKFQNEKCEACMSFMEEFNKGLEEKFELIETAILDQCYQLPEQDQQRCLKEVKLELDALYEKIKNFVEPNKVCKFFHLCK